MTSMLGCHLGNLFRGIAPSSSEPPWFTGGQYSSCKGDVGVLVMNGANDEFNVLIEDGYAVRDFWRNENSCASDTTVYQNNENCDATNGCDDDMPVLLCVHDAGHSWPAEGSFMCSGERCYDAGIVIRTFFDQLP